MGMPVSAAGDQSLGHAFTPSPITPTIANVLVSGKPVHSVGDIIAIHVLGNSAHLGAIGLGSTTVFASGKGVAKIRTDYFRETSIALRSSKALLADPRRNSNDGLRLVRG